MSNIRDVARRSGFSVATVSRVLNHPHTVSPATREKIYEVMRDMDYTPNTFARGLALDKSQAIAVVLPNVLDHSYVKLVKGVEEISQAHEYFVILCDSENNREKEKKTIDLLVKGRRVDGLILVNSLLSDEELEALQRENIPLVLAGRQRPLQGINTVCIDYSLGGYQAGQHLLRLGYRSLGMISQKSGDREDEEKYRGFLRALKEEGLTPDPIHLIEAEKTIRGGTLAAKKLLQQQNLPQALFVSSDAAALAVLKHLETARIRVPGDISLIGFDDLEMTELVSPRLTTISIPLYKMGLLAARLLFDEIENRDYESQEIFLQLKLMIRESCGHGATAY